MIICSSSNIDLIQGITGYGTVSDGATDWRIENTPTGVFNILNSPNLLVPNVSIIDVGNVGIGTIPISGTNKLQVQGAASVSGLITANTLTSSGLITANAGITVNTGSLTCANDTLSKTYTATNTTAGTNDILTMRYDTTNGIRFRQTLVATNDVRYDLIQKTNNVDYTAPVISFYKGNVGIGTTNPVNILQVGSGGKLRLANDNADFSLIGSSDANSATNPRIIISGTTRSGNQGNIEYLSTTSTGMHAFYTTDSTTERMRIASNGNVAIGTTDTATYKLNVGGTINATSVLVNGAAITASSPSQWSGTTKIYYNGGNVGIGTDDPTARLDVLTTLRIRGYGPALYFGNDLTTHIYRHQDSQEIRFVTGNVDNRMIIASNGNVSIGNTETTTYPLNVTGNINVSGGYFVSGTAFKPATATTADKLTTPRQINGVNFDGSDNITIAASKWSGTTNIYYNGGNVGIGETNTGGFRLYVNQSLRIGKTGAVLDFGDDFGVQIYRFNDSKELRFVTGSVDNRMILDTSGRLSIGTTDTATETLNLRGSISLGTFNTTASTNYVGYYNFSSGNSCLVGMEIENTTLGGNYSQKLHFHTHHYATTTGRKLTIEENGTITIPGHMNVKSMTITSDRRIKKDIEEINDENALNKLLLIQPTTYNYIDEDNNKGFGKVYGFIAQQIREVIPEAVIIRNYVIPNIYKNCLIYNKREIHHSIPLDTPIDYEVKIKGASYKIKEIYDDYFVIDKDIDADEIFVYGYEVNDFHTLSKDYIYTLNVCATQELHRRIEAQNVVIKSQDDRIKDLEAKVEMLLNNSRA